MIDYAEEAKNKLERGNWQNALVFAILDLANAVRCRTMSAPFVTGPGTWDPPYDITCTEPGATNVIVPFCPYCAMPLSTAGDCTNVACHKPDYQGSIGSIGDEPV